jgi:hypothetical protein
MPHTILTIIAAGSGGARSGRMNVIAKANLDMSVETVDSKISLEVC